MKNSLKKVLAGISAVAMLAVAMPITSAFAEDTVDTTVADDSTTDEPAADPSEILTSEMENGDSISYRVVGEGAVITEFVNTEADTITVPATIDEKAVIGIDDFAFANVTGDVTINVPDTLAIANMGNEAFMTSAVISKVTATGGSSIHDVLSYWVNDVAGMGYTDEQIADAVKRAYAKIDEAQVAADTIEKTTMNLIKAIKAGECGFSQANIDKMNMALSTMSYAGVKLKVATNQETPEIVTYAAAKKDLECEVGGAYIIGDTNLSGKLDLQDAILIAKFLLNGELTDEQQAAGDYNQNGKIDLQDAIGVAKELLKK